MGSFRKLSDVISVDDSGSNDIFRVNGQWQFTLPDGLSYETGGEFTFIEGGFDLSGSTKPLVLKEGWSLYGQVFCAAVEPHFSFTGNYETIIGCKYDNRFGPDNDMNSRKIIIDDPDFYVDLISINTWPFGTEATIRVRGDSISPYNITMMVKPESDAHWSHIADYFNKIANSIGKVSTATKKTKSNSQTKMTMTDPNCIMSGTVLEYYTGWDDDIVLPDGITELADNIFSGRADLRSIVIPDSVKIIGRRAFENCFNLESVVLPEGLRTIGSYAFVDCHNLETINLGSKLENIGDSAFSECFKMKNVVLSSKLRDIDAFTFKNCTTFTKLVIPEGVVSIGFTAFAGCSNLEYLYIPASVTEIYDNFLDQTPFDGCNNLTIHCPAGSYAAEYAESHGIPWVTDSTPAKAKKAKASPVPQKKAAKLVAPAGCELNGTELSAYDGSVSRVVIPEGVTEIGFYTFRENTVIREVEIPSTMDGNVKGFYNCTSLESVKIAEGITAIDSICFYECSALKRVQLPSTLQRIESSAFTHCSSLQEIQFPESLSFIGEYAFADCNSLRKVKLPSKLTQLGELAFWNCTEIEEVSIPAGVSVIGASTFSNCEKLKSIDIPETVREIGENAFLGCNALTSIKIPRGVEIIGDDPFSCCENLKEIYIPATVKQIGKNLGWVGERFKCVHVEEGSFAEQYCKENYIRYDTYYDGLVLPPIPELPENWEQLQQVAAIEEVMDIEGGILRKCVSEKNHVEIPEGVVEIGEAACADLMAHSVKLPSTLKKIGNSAFWRAVNLESVIVPEGVTEIGQFAFHLCSSLQNITLPDSLESLGNYAFCSCSALQSITLPPNIKLLPENCFQHCANLIHIVLPQSLTTIEKDVFCKCTSLRSLLIPKNVTFIGALSSFDFYSSGLRELVIMGNDCEIESVLEYTDVYAPAESRTKELLKKHSRIKAHNLEQWVPIDMTRISVNESDYEFNEDDPWGSMHRANALRAQQRSECLCGNIDKLTTKYVDVMDSVRVVCADSFYDSALYGIYLPDSVEEVQHDAFRSCENLNHVRLPSGLEELEEGVLSGCPLRTLELPAALRRIGKDAFGTTRAQAIVFPPLVEYVDVKMFYPEWINVRELYVTGMDTRILGDWSAAKNPVVIYAYPGSAAQHDAVCKENLRYVELKADMIPKMDVKAEIERQYQLDLKLYGQNNEYIQTQLKPVLEEARKIKEAKEAERKRKEAEEAERRRKAEAEEAERRRKAAEEAERKRQEELAKKRARYNEINESLTLQMQIISQNKGWFGAQAKARKAAQEQIAILQAQLASEFPDGRP